MKDNMVEKTIKINRAQCVKCKETIESKHVHDFQWCKCHSIAVDGGNQYLKRTGNREDIIELSEYSDIYS